MARPSPPLGMWVEIRSPHTFFDYSLDSHPDGAILSETKERNHDRRNPHRPSHSRLLQALWSLPARPGRERGPDLRLHRIYHGVQRGLRHPRRSPGGCGPARGQALCRSPVEAKPPRRASGEGFFLHPLTPSPMWLDYL